MRKRRLPSLKKLIPWLAILAATAAINLAARYTDGFAEWYALTIYPLLVGIFGRFFSIFPFSVVEILLYLLIAAVIVGIVRLFLHRLTFRTAASFLGGTACVLLFTYTLGCGINYHRSAFSEKAGFELSESTEDELAALCSFLAEEMNTYAEMIAVDEDGYFVLDVDVEAEAVSAMQAVGAQYTDLAGYYPRAKSVLFWQLLSYQQLEGVYSPFTFEANFNGDAPDVDQPASVCHELSHLKGFMREDEANFIAYLACIYSESAAFNYSGTMTAYIYSINALYAYDRGAALDINASLNEQASRDLSAHNAYWNAYEGTVSEVSDKVNDAYLKANAQEDGTRSYGRMVDLMLAWYKGNI